MTPPEVFSQQLSGEPVNGLVAQIRRFLPTPPFRLGVVSRVVV
jgi:hypothetical protein